jgi:hypothetical protein
MIVRIIGLIRKFSLPTLIRRYHFQNQIGIHIIITLLRFRSQKEILLTPQPSPLFPVSVQVSSNARIVPANALPVEGDMEQILLAIFETPDSDLDYEHAVAFGDLEDWTLVYLFQFYVQEVGKPIASLTELNVSIGSGNPQKFVVGRYREERKWQNGGRQTQASI